MSHLISPVADICLGIHFTRYINTSALLSKDQHASAVTINYQKQLLPAEMSHNNHNKINKKLWPQTSTVPTFAAPHTSYLTVQPDGLDYIVEPRHCQHGRVWRPGT